MMKDLQLQIQETTTAIRELSMNMGIDPDTIEVKTPQEITADLIRLNEELKGMR